MEWIRSAKTFFVPVKVLSAVFRGVLCRLIEDAINKDEIKLPRDTANFQVLKTKCYDKKWVVYAQKPFSLADKLIPEVSAHLHKMRERKIECNY